MPEHPFPFHALYQLTERKGRDGQPRDDKGTRAALRRLLSDTRRSKAVGWMALGALGAGSFADDPVAETVAGIYGLHPKPSHDKEFNFGATCRKLREKKSKDFSEPHPFDNHFRRLLGARTQGDACKVVQRIARMAEAEGIEINFERLFYDLCRWEDDWPRRNWTRAYFRTPQPEDDSEITAPAVHE
ncbi:MAG: type I-E CRISPR-associated protein Cse2/CasB [Verrucomicrobiales bacterium]